MSEVCNACDVPSFTSLNEGCGYHIVKVFVTKFPVVASDIEVFKESSGDVAILRNPNNVSDIVSGVMLAIEDLGELKIKG